MPPFIPRKRRQSMPPPEAPTLKKAKKPSLFDTLDKPTAGASVQDNKAFLEKLDDSGDESSLSTVSSSEFEDATPVDKFPDQSKAADDVEEDEE
ncbi:MAG: hypothetical protein Q9187_008878, partial [Circinaria calcarea]